MLPVRKNEISLRNSSGGPEYLRPVEGTLLSMQTDIHTTLYPFYTTEKMPHVTVTITKTLRYSNSKIY